jgi:hypothetical protein
MQNQVIDITPMRQKKGFTGNRYTRDQKKRVTQFVQEYDAKHGRGGIAAAQRQFKVSYIALRNWLMGGDGQRKKGTGLKPVFTKLTSIKGQMKDLERELRRLRRHI